MIDTTLPKYLRKWREEGCEGLPSQRELESYRGSTPWYGKNRKTGKEWKLVKHGEGSYTCYY